MQVSVSSSNSSSVLVLVPMWLHVIHAYCFLCCIADCEYQGAADYEGVGAADCEGMGAADCEGVGAAVQEGARAVVEDSRYVIYKCLLCTKRFSSGDGLINHLNHHDHEKFEWPFLCPYCGYGHKLETLVSQHCTRVHRGNVYGLNLTCYIFWLWQMWNHFTAIRLFWVLSLFCRLKWFEIDIESCENEKGSQLF